jgi:hypothetical protein
MKVEFKEVTVRELTDGYEDNEESGVFGYGGKLDIRPPYQREFIYKDKQRDAVIDTVTKNFPLNVMYWAVSDDETFEIIDGQQRTISICQFVEGDFSFEKRYFHNLQQDEQDQVLNYKLTIYLCSGTDRERLDWFETINIAGEELTDQELRNAVYSGSWVSDAKRYFSKSGCPASGIGRDYLSGSPIRQDYLETAIKWFSEESIEGYMAEHQHDQSAVKLWNYFQNVINWVKAVFPNYRREMRGIEWGELYNEFKDQNFDSAKFEEEIKELMIDDDVTKKKGIYPYLLTEKEKFLNIRKFSEKMRRGAYERQDEICPVCDEHFEIEEMDADHITPWHEGGKTNTKNCQMLCKEDNRRKSGK